MLSSEYLLDPLDFQTFTNPRILGETVTQEHQWEFCLSFPNIRCMVKRPVGIHVSFLNDFGEEQDLKLFDFQARVFLHEMDHLEGKTMIHWNISEGNIDVLRTHLDENKHFMSTVEYYKQKIEGLKKNFSHMFEEHRKYETIKDD